MNKKQTKALIETSAALRKEAVKLKNDRAFKKDEQVVTDILNRLNQFDKNIDKSAVDKSIQYQSQVFISEGINDAITQLSA